MPTESTVYFMQAGDGGPVKIGSAVDVEKRLRALQGGCPYELRVIGLLEGGPWLECQIHRRFEAHKIRGEWFNPVEEILEVARGNAPPLIEAVQRPKNKPVPDPNDVWMDERMWNIRKDIEQLYKMGKTTSEIGEIFRWTLERTEEEMAKMERLGYFRDTALRDRTSIRGRRVA